ncbi:MAG: MFS transporter, partial [Actinomycetota bacterium]|nr:MFS transporter [Actinomycetota bacterium]
MSDSDEVASAQEMKSPSHQRPAHLSTEYAQTDHAPTAARDQRRPAHRASEAPQDGPATDQPSGNKWWTLAVVCFGTFMLLLDITIVNVALPDIQGSLGSSFSDLQWVIDAYALTLASLLLTAGSLSDIFGRRKLYIIGLTIFTIAS